MVLVFEDSKIVKYQIKGEIIILHSFFLCLKSWILYSGHRECDWNVAIDVIQDKSTMTQEQAVTFCGIPFFTGQGLSAVGDLLKKRCSEEVPAQGTVGQGNARHCFLGMAVNVE